MSMSWLQYMGLKTSFVDMIFRILENQGVSESMDANESMNDH